ncbi:MAG: OB-fold domain-containing protein [Gammaproteobacteria bacterium]|nr:OB-fold domain-containing protein [Gammaproteobacteria bacterium]
MTATITQPNLVPLRSGMYEMPDSIDGTPRLYGQRCTSCGEIFTTTHREYCAYCGKQTMESRRLGTIGIVQTFTIVHQELKGSLMETPYVIARVQLTDDRVQIQTVLCDVEPNDVTIGMQVEICLKQVDEDEDKQIVVSFFFRPATRS